MDALTNPYSPGAGSRPPALVGRDSELSSMQVALLRLLAGRQARSVMLTGLRGVGKTVLLGEFGRAATAAHYVHEQFEVDEFAHLPSSLASALRRTILSLSPSRRVQAAVTKALGILKAFSVRWSTLELRLEVEAVGGPADSGDLGQDLAGLLCAVGELARARETGVFLTIDEIQYLSKKDFGALILGLHQVVQRELPLLVAGAGLPSVAALASDAKSYAERLFEFRPIDSLSVSDATSAIVLPAQAMGVHWHQDAVLRVVDMTRGYPYFLQEFAQQAWAMAPGPVDIRPEDVERSADVARDELDARFFELRAQRTTGAERRYLLAMAALGGGPYSSAQVAEAAGRTTAQLGVVRESLIRKGICYAPRWGEIAFTVPMFDEFLRRRRWDADGR